MVDYIPTEKGMTIRQPSTANLMIDSSDRSNYDHSPWDCQFHQDKNLINGFFTRLGLSELVLDWSAPNVTADPVYNVHYQYENDPNIFRVVDNSGNHAIVCDGTWTVAELLNYIVAELNHQSGGYKIVKKGVYNAGAPATFNFVSIQNTTKTFTISGSNLTERLAISGNQIGVALNFVYIGSEANLQIVRYIDFVSQDLTYNQDLKDGTTTNSNYTVLARWYFAWDNPPLIDEYGFPVLMGYTAFNLRRIFNPPKQIRWTPNMPLGNFSVQVYDDYGHILKATSPIVNYNANSWLMTLQVSEV